MYVVLYLVTRVSLPDQKRAALPAGKMVACCLGNRIDPVNSSKCVATHREFLIEEFLVLQQDPPPAFSEMADRIESEQR